MPNLMARKRPGRLVQGAAAAVTTLLASAGTVLATAAEHADAAGHGGGGGLPQLNPATFPPQLIWLALTFAVLYYLMSKKALPRVAEVLEARQERISNDLEKAAAFKDESTAVIAAYEKALAEARAQAQTVIAETVSEINTAASARQAEFAADLAKKTAETEARIARARDVALENVRSIASEIARDVAAKFGGLEVDPTAAEQAVTAVMQERG